MLSSSYCRAAWLRRYENVKPFRILTEHEMLEVAVVQIRYSKDAQSSSQISTTWIPTTVTYLQAGCPSCRRVNASEHWREMLSQSAEINRCVLSSISWSTSRAAQYSVHHAISLVHGRITSVLASLCYQCQVFVEHKLQPNISVSQFPSRVLLTACDSSQTFRWQIVFSQFTTAAWYSSQPNPCT